MISEYTPNEYMQSFVHILVSATEHFPLQKKMNDRRATDDRTRKTGCDRNPEDPPFRRRSFQEDPSLARRRRKKPHCTR